MICELLNANQPWRVTEGGAAIDLAPSDPRKLTPAEIAEARRTFAAIGLDPDAMDFDKVTISFRVGIKKSTTYICPGGCDAVSTRADPNRLVFDASLAGSQQGDYFQSALMHEVTHPYVYQVVFESDLAGYQRAGDIYNWSGIPHDQRPWEQTGNAARDWWVLHH